MRKNPLLDLESQERFKQELLKMSKEKTQFFLLKDPFSFNDFDPTDPRVSTALGAYTYLGGSNPSSKETPNALTIAILPPTFWILCILHGLAKML